MSEANRPIIRVVLPFHLRTLANIQGSEISLPIPLPSVPVTITTLLDALEARYPTLAGTIREHGSVKRRPMIRFYACQEDLSHDAPDAPLPEKVTSGQEPFYVVGAIAGG